LAEPARQQVPAAAPRPRVKTFDVFDTLIARRCVEAKRVFEIVETRSGLAGFAAHRVAAEAEVAHAPYTFETIYAALAARLGLDPEATRSLSALELAVEQENAIPIAENIAAVADGDVLISDMYLGAEAIRSLLRAAGFDRPVSVIVSSDGKRSGRVWPQALAAFDISEHCGDNMHSDVLMALAAGVRARATDVHRPTRIEAALADMGLRDLAALSRETRLATHSPDPQIRALQIVEADFNLPILALASVLLLRRAVRSGVRKILFSSRDGNIWLPMARAIAASRGLDIAMDYFFTSRLTRVKPSESYLDYARKTITPGSIVVDVCGTGWSLAHLFERLGLRGQTIAFLQKLPARADYEAMAPTPPGSEIAQLFAEVESVNNTAIEMCNYATHGMVIDVRDALGSPVAIFAEDRRSARVKNGVEAQQATARIFLDALRRRPLAETLGFDDDSLARLGGALYRGLAAEAAVYALYFDEHMAEDRDALARLR